MLLVARITLFGADPVRPQSGRSEADFERSKAANRRDWEHFALTPDLKPGVDGPRISPEDAQAPEPLDERLDGHGSLNAEPLEAPILLARSHKHIELFQSENYRKYLDSWERTPLPGNAPPGVLALPGHKKAKRGA